MELPKQKTEASKKWRDQKFLIIGPGKTGKSAFLAEDERALFLECESGLNHLSVMKVPIRGWDDIRAVYGALAKEVTSGKELAYDLLVIDTGDKMADFAQEEVICRAQEKFKKVEINAISDVPNGAGWFQFTKLFHNALDKFSELPLAVAVISHYSMKEIQEPTRKYHKETISISGQCGTKLIHWADHTLNLKASYVGHELRRHFVTKPSLAVEAGSRGNVVPDGFKLNVDMAENYKRFRELFD